MWEHWQRSEGVLTRAGIERLRGKTVGIAGLGGVGGLLAERLSRTGIGGLRLADPDRFEVPDMNRQLGCSAATLGRSKARVLAEMLAAVAPSTRVETVEGRVSRENAAAFVAGTDLVACEIHAEARDDIVAVCEAGRAAQVPVIATSLYRGFGAAMCCFAPDGPDPCLLLDYLHWRQAEGRGAEAQPVEPQPLASTSPACAVAAGIASAEITMSLAGLRPLEILMPRVLVVDPKLYRMEVIDLGTFIDSCERLFDSWLQPAAPAG